MRKFSFLMSIIGLLLIFSFVFGLEEPHKYFKRWPSGIPADSSYFPIAVWLQSSSNAAAYKAAGINLFIGLWNGPTSAQLNDLYAAGMRVICDQNSTGLTHAHKDMIIGWMHGDEPDNAQSNNSGGYDPCIPPDTLLKDYQAWRNADSTRPILLNLGQGVSYINWVGRGTCTGHTEMYPQYIRTCDIVSYDIYPVNSTYSAVKGNLWYVPKGVDSLELWSGNAKPVWCWIECTLIDSGGQAPVAAQIRSEVWMALIHGANGFGYFCHSFYPTFVEAGWLNNTSLKAAITAINQRVQGLAAALNSPGRNSLLNLQTSRVSVPIDALVKTSSGATYVFSAAMRNDTATGTFTLTGFPGAMTVDVLDESRSLTMTNGVFKDAFTGYAVHLYKISTLPAGIQKPALATRNRALEIAPHPFSQTLNISVDRSLLPAIQSIEIYSASGQKVRGWTLGQGVNSVVWDGKDFSGRPMAEGFYVVRSGPAPCVLSRSAVLLR